MREEHRETCLIIIKSLISLLSLLFSKRYAIIVWVIILKWRLLCLIYGTGDIQAVSTNSPHG